MRKWSVAREQSRLPNLVYEPSWGMGRFKAEQRGEARRLERRRLVSLAGRPLGVSEEEWGERERKKDPEERGSRATKRSRRRHGISKRNRKAVVTVAEGVDGEGRGYVTLIPQPRHTSGLNEMVEWRLSDDARRWRNFERTLEDVALLSMGYEPSRELPSDGRLRWMDDERVHSLVRQYGGWVDPPAGGFIWRCPRCLKKFRWRGETEAPKSEVERREWVISHRELG